jgi:hypothetical protein
MGAEIKRELEDTLNRLLANGAFDKVVDFLLERSADERTHLAKPARTYLRKSTSHSSAPDKKSARLAVLGTNPFESIAHMRWDDEERFFSRWTDWRLQMYRLVSALRPVWLQPWAELMLKQSLDNWAFVRRMVREGLCRKPLGNEYTLGLMREMRWRFSSCGASRKDRGTKGFSSVQAALLADPDLLKEDLWKIFEIEGNDKCNLQALEPGPFFSEEANSWRYALVWLAHHKHLSRDRLLDASLEALGRGFTPHRAGWFTRLHEDLEPTIEERAKRTKKYLRLLGDPNPNNATFALEALLNLDQAKPLKGNEVMEAIEPVFALKAKGTVKSALRWLEQIVKREPKLARDAVYRAAAALSHETADVQTAAFKFIEAKSVRDDPRLRERIEQCRGAIAPTLRSRIDGWLGTATAPSPQKSVDTAAAPSSRKTVIPRLDASRRITPISSFEELIDRATFVLENPHAIEEAERVLDGLLRLGAQRPENSEPRMARLLEAGLMPFWVGNDTELERAAEKHAELLRWKDGVAGLMALVLKSWATGQRILHGGEVEKPVNPESHFPLHYNRLAALTDLLLENVQLPLLSAPTHRGGWIDPMALVERLKAWRAQDRPVEPHDFALALLRLAPENKETALTEAEKLGGETGEAFAYALGAENVSVGHTSGFWVAAARSRNPFLDDPAVEQRHPGLGPDAGLAARFYWKTGQITEHFKSPFQKAVIESVAPELSPKTSFKMDQMTIGYTPALPKKVETALVSVMMHAGFSADGFNHRLVINQLKWTFTLWPNSREPLFATLVHWLMFETNSFEYRQGYRHPIMQVTFEALVDSHTWLGPMASLLLTLTLLSPDAECRDLGIKGFTASVEDGRFNADILGSSLAKLLPTSLCKCARLVQSLAEVSRVSPGHALAVAAVIENAMRGEASRAPRDLGKLLELWLQLNAAHNLRVTSVEARDFLKNLTTGQAAKMARQLLK